QDAAARLAAARAEHPTWSDDELAPWAEAKARFSLESMPQLRAPQQPAPWRDTYRRLACPSRICSLCSSVGGMAGPLLCQWTTAGGILAAAGEMVTDYNGTGSTPA